MICLYATLRLCIILSYFQFLFWHLRLLILFGSTRNLMNKAWLLFMLEVWTLEEYFILGCFHFNGMWKWINTVIDIHFLLLRDSCWSKMTMLSCLLVHVKASGFVVFKANSFSCCLLPWGLFTGPDLISSVLKNNDFDCLAFSVCCKPWFCISHC